MNDEIIIELERRVARLERAFRVMPFVAAIAIMVAAVVLVIFTKG